MNDDIRKIYADYERTIAEVRKAAPALAGAFGIVGDDPRNHPCHDAFYEELGTWTAELLAAKPDAEQACEIVRFLLAYPADHRGTDTYWYAYAAQKYALDLIPLLTGSAAAELLTDFRVRYPRREWLPVQKQIVKQLSRQTGDSAETKTADWLRHFCFWNDPPH